MRLLDDVKALGGVVVIPRGTEMTTSLIERVRHFPPGFVQGGAVRVRRV
jgi:hypothetical protein